MLGWVFELPALKAVLPGMTTMKFNAALGLVFASFGLLIIPRRNLAGATWRYLAVVAMGLATTLLGTLSLGEYLGLPFSIDELLVADPHITSPPYPGRMSPATAAGLASGGAAVVLLASAMRTPRSARPAFGFAFAHLLAAIPAAIGYLSLAGYAYQVDGLYKFGPYVSVAMQTAIGLILLALGILFTLPDLGWRSAFADRPIALDLLTRLLPLAVAAPFIAGLLVVQGIRHGIYDALYGPALLALAAAATSFALAWIATVEVRRAEGRLRMSEAQLQSLVETAADGFVIAQADGQIQMANPAMHRLFGYNRFQELIGRNLWGLIPDAASLHCDRSGQCDRSGAILPASKAPRMPGGLGRERLAIRRDGSSFPIDLSVSSFNINGSHRLTGIIRDATARKQAEAALRDTEARLRLFIDGAPVAIAMFDSAMCYLAVSHRFLIDYRIDEQTPASLIGRSHYALFPETSEYWRSIHHRVLSGETLSAQEEPFQCPNGDVDWVRWEMVPWHHSDGGVAGALLFSENITERKMAEAALYASEARLRLVQQVGGIAYSDRLMAEPTMLISEEFARIHGLPLDQTRVAVEQWLAMLHSEDRDRYFAARQELFDNGGPTTIEFRVHRADGEVRWITARGEVFRGPDGKPFRTIAAWQDITDIVAVCEALASRQQELEQRVTERTLALAEAEARFRGIFDSQLQFISLLAPDGTVLEMNRTALEAAALSRTDIVGRPFWEADWWPIEERDRLRQEVTGAASGALVYREVEVRGARGRHIWIDFSLKPVRDLTTGAVISIIAESRDQTEKRNLAAQLAQAQKVQALGQLAGGIAHDFNNILQAVSGAAMLIEQKPGDLDRTRRLAGTMISAANRGTSITQRLLSFARRGELRSVSIPTTHLLNGVCEVLAHTLGTTITVAVNVTSDVPPLVADQAQLETALINLGTNARDAMPNGGTLTLSAAIEHVDAFDHHPAGLSPGDYVRLSVADNGAGMDAATLARASEPFFTTKPSGQGTGLGLAMVKGFAEQSGGGLAITSVPGRGTTVVMWLRQAGGECVQGHDKEAADPIGVELAARILIVDDDDLVRETVAAQLEAEGFTTLMAASGLEAVAMIEAGEIVDAMVSDLSMPGINGVTTIQKVRAQRPRLPCFLLTGYVGERAALSNEDAFTLVRKPVVGRVLAAQIEASLAGVKRSGALLSG